MSTHDIHCPGSEELAALHDGELAGSDRERVEVHVATCENCARALRALRRTSQLLGSLPRDEASEDLVRDVVRRATGSARPRSWRRIAIPLASAAVMLTGVMLLTRIVREQEENEHDRRSLAVGMSEKPSQAPTPSAAEADPNARGNEVAQPSPAAARERNAETAPRVPVTDGMASPASNADARRRAKLEASGAKKDQFRPFAPEPPAEEAGVADSAESGVEGGVEGAVVGGVVGGVLGGRLDETAQGAASGPADIAASQPRPASMPAAPTSGLADRGDGQANSAGTRPGTRDARRRHPGAAGAGILGINAEGAP